MKKIYKTPFLLSKKIATVFEAAVELRRIIAGGAIHHPSLIIMFISVGRTYRNLWPFHLAPLTPPPSNASQ